MEKQLRRSKKDSVLGGVAGGLAKYFNIDVVIVRLLFVVSLFVSFGVSLFAYIVLWVALPEEPSYLFGNPEAATAEVVPVEPVPSGSGAGSDRNLKIIAIGLIAFGTYMLLDQYIVWYSLGKFFWPLALIGIGAFLLLRKRDQDYEARNPDPGREDTTSRFDANDQLRNTPDKDDTEDSFKVN
ncbi:MAG: hypothetical protein ABS46_07165 [Cytophagaceae bacterium SCN 52-12]|nr:MAG: hypothetical protein ABS46_07165 [Cytophagaceae bacterium SCN 52-12]